MGFGLEDEFEAAYAQLPEGDSGLIDTDVTLQEGLQLNALPKRKVILEDNEVGVIDDRLTNG